MLLADDILALETYLLLYRFSLDIFWINFLVHNAKLLDTCMNVDAVKDGFKVKL